MPHHTSYFLGDPFAHAFNRTLKLLRKYEKQTTSIE